MKYNTFDICSIVLRNMATQAAQSIEYPTWSDEFAREQTIGIVGKIKESLWFEPVNPALLTEEQMKILMFNKWDEESGIMLIPLYLRQFIKEGTPVMSISNETSYFSLETTDNDHRYGCLAYGVIPAKEAEPASE